MFDNITTAWPLAKRQLRALAVTIPCVRTSRLKCHARGNGPPASRDRGRAYSLRRTPPEIVKRLNTEIVKILKLPDVNEKLVGLGAQPVGNSSEDFTVMVKAEVVKWADVVKKSGAKVD